MPRPLQRIDTLQTTELAEGVEIHLRTAGPFLRMVAWALDLAVTIGLLIVFGILSLLIALFSGFENGFERVSSGFMMLAFFTVFWFYPVIFEAGKKGSTWGKRALGLRVVNESGTRITMGQAMVRNFIRGMELILPILPLVAFFHPRFQRLGDLAAGTLVVYARPRVDPVEASPPSLQSVPVQVALTREEQAAILSFRDRNTRWSEARKVELINHLAPLSGKDGPEGLARVLGMARWLEERK